MKDKPYGMADYYKFFCENNPYIKLTKQQYNNIISEYNKKLSEHLIENLVLNLPYRLGKLEILKVKRKAYLDKNGELKNNVPIDWKSTNELWSRNPEMKANKVLIRYNNTNTNGYVFRVYYNKGKAVYKNKSIYFCKPVRSLARGITKRINDYSKIKYDAYIKKTYNND